MADMDPPIGPAPSRFLSDDELATLLALDIPAHLATIDRDGFPRITPNWFLWADGSFYMTSVGGRRHLRDLARNPRASICTDTEDHLAIGGVRRNHQVKARGTAELWQDIGGAWTKRITRKSVTGSEGEALAERCAAMPRTVIRLHPDRIVGIGTP